MHLLVLYDREISYRYRIGDFAPLLHAHGWTVEAHWMERSLRHRMEMIRRAQQADVVLLQRRLIAGWSRWMLRRASRRLIYDFDDAIYLRDSNSPKAAHCGRRLRRFAAAVASADAVTAGNRHLLKMAARFARPGRAQFVPTCVDVQRYGLAEHWRRGQQMKLVWIGTSSTLPSLEEARDGLALAAARHKGMHLRVVCDAFPEWDDVPIERRTWSGPREPADLAEADIGISWLPEHPWSAGKCGLKVLQYMAAGLPVVANAVGVHRELIEHGRTGFLASTPREWSESIARLSASPALRKLMGQRGRQLVESRYSSQAAGASLVELLNRLASKVPAYLQAA